MSGSEHLPWVMHCVRISHTNSLRCLAAQLTFRLQTTRVEDAQMAPSGYSLAKDICS